MEQENPFIISQKNPQKFEPKFANPSSKLPTGGLGVEIAGVDGEIRPGGGQLDPLRRLINHRHTVGPVFIQQLIPIAPYVSQPGM